MNRRFWHLILICLIGATLLAMLVSPEQAAATERAFAITAFGILSGFCLVHSFIYRRTIQDAEKQQVELQSGLQESEAARTDLEERLAERTRESNDSERLLQSTIDGIGDPVIFIDTEFRVTTMNRAAREAYGDRIDSDEPVYCYSAMHDLKEPCDPTQNSCTLLTGEASKNIQTRVANDGGEYLVEFRTTPLCNEFGKITGAVAVAHDLNDSEKIALRLRRDKDLAETASRAKSEFVATMSHEVRTPMNAVVGMTDMLRLTKLTRKQQNYIRIIQSSADMLLSLVDNMLDFSRLEAGTLDLQKSEFDVVDLLERVLEMMGYQAYSKRIELAGVIRHDSMLRVSADGRRLRQIMVNLVSNAIKFTVQGEVIISIGVDSAADGQTSLSVSVSDSGIGIKEESKSMLFTPFVRVVNGTAKQHQGSGLGLTISKQLVDSMGGEIGLESELGKGTKAWFAVPVDVIRKPDPDSADRTRALENRRTLIVNNNKKVAASICDYLTSCGMHCEAVDKADGVLDGLRAAAGSSQAYDCTIIDADLPGAGGLSLAREIRTDKALEKLPVILLTSIALPVKVGTVSKIGGIRCVNKPVLPSELRHNLRRAMDADDSAVAGDDSWSNCDLRILVAEDNPINRKLLVDMLKSLNHAADSVQDGPSVLAALEQRPYDLVLMDCQMPGMDGDEVTREVRDNSSRYRSQPIVVAVTADHSAEHKTKCLRAGMDDFLAKPIRLEKLKSGLNQWSSLLGKDIAKINDSRAGLAARVEANVFTQLRDRAGVNRGAFVTNYIDLFLQDTATRLEVLRAALERQDHVTLGRESHALKGACLEFGVTRMSDCCDALRKAITEGHFDKLPEALHRLRQEFNRVKPVFEAEKNRPA